MQRARPARRILLLVAAALALLGCAPAQKRSSPNPVPPVPPREMSDAAKPTAPTPAPELPVILLTGFEPFGGGTVNASWEAVRGLDGQELAGCRIVARELPVVWGAPLEKLPKLLDELHPVAVFAFGQGLPGRVAHERVGANARGKYRDNRKQLPPSPLVVEGGPDLLGSNFALDKVLPALEKTGVPVRLSGNAGQFLCDETVYTLEHLRRSRGGFECAFFHVPALGSKIEVAGKEIECSRELLRGFVEALVKSWASQPGKLKAKGQ